MTITQAISVKVLAVMATTGKDVMDALREVCGTEAVDQMISDLYDELRKKGAA